MIAPKKSIKSGIIRARADLFHIETTVAQAKAAGMELTEDEAEALKFLELITSGATQALRNVEARL